MTKPNFFEGVIVAVLTSVSGAAMYTVLTSVFGVAISARLTLLLLCSSYLIYLLWRSPKSTGRMTAVLFWGVMLFGSWLIDPPFIVYLFIHLASLWLVRAFAFYRSIASALADLALSGLSLAVSLWAYLNTHSVLLALWSLFLVQALFCLIPRQWQHKDMPDAMHYNDRFMQAHRNAEVALRKVSAIH